MLVTRHLIVGLAQREALVERAVQDLLARVLQEGAHRAAHFRLASFQVLQLDDSPSAWTVTVAAAPLRAAAGRPTATLKQAPLVALSRLGLGSWRTFLEASQLLLDLGHRFLRANLFLDGVRVDAPLCAGANRHDLLADKQALLLCRLHQGSAPNLLLRRYDIRWLLGQLRLLKLLLLIVFIRTGWSR